MSECMYDRVAQYILDNPDCKKEIIWLLKKHFKDEKALIESYSDVMYNPIKDDQEKLERLKKEALEEKLRYDAQWEEPCNNMNEEDWDYRG